jgi:hypothetical protein
VLFMISFFDISKAILHKLDFYRSSFFGKGIIIIRNAG